MISQIIEITNVDTAKLMEPAIVFWPIITPRELVPHFLPPNSAMVSEIVKREMGK